jgi:hypothetical protein
MSGKDLLKKSLASHRAKTKAEKRKRDAEEEGRGTGVKQKGNFFCGSGGRGRGKYFAENNDNNEPPFSIQPGLSETIPLDGWFYFTIIFFLSLRLIILFTLHFSVYR